MTGANVLVAIFGEKDSHAVYFLHQQGVTRLDVVNYISHGITKAPAGAAGEREEGETETEAPRGADGRRRSRVHPEPEPARRSTARSIR